MTKINISIPKPCHENWQAMTPENKGRFCDSCQKKVFDFTSSSDRDIINAFQKDNNLCGRFLNSQLDRDLIKPKVRSTIWLAATTALISLIHVNEITAQEKAPTVQTDRMMLGKFMVTEPKEIKNKDVEVSGIVSDNSGTLPGATITIKNSDVITTSDINGNFTIKAKENDILVISFVGYAVKEIQLPESDKLQIVLKENIVLDGVSLGIIVRRTFFGRLFHRIGNLFR